MQIQGMERSQGPVPGERLLTVAEAGDRLSVSERLIWRYLEEGSLPRVRLGGATRIRQSDLERLMQEGLPSSRPDNPEPRAALVQGGSHAT